MDLDIRIKDTSHPAGLIELEDGRFMLVSNHVPSGLKIASLEDIFMHMEQSKNPPSTRFRFSDANVTILPPSF